jgi:hypothetical protein
MTDYEIFTNALTGAGTWSWWDENLPDLFQIEFDAVKLWIPFPDAPDTPSHHISLRFKNPASIAFLTPKDTTNPSDWYKLLKQEKWKESLTIDPHDFTFTDAAAMKKMLEASTIKVHHGINPLEKTFFDSKVKLVFLTENGGLALAAESLCLVDFEGEIPFDMVGRLSQDWWDYWREYGDAKTTSTPFKQDLLCEITISLEKKT